MHLLSPGPTKWGGAGGQYRVGCGSLPSRGGSDEGAVKFSY